MKIKKLFGGYSMKWPSVILFAVITGVYTGIIMLLPFLKNTSFQDIGISYEWWVVFAVILVSNCEKNWEAMIKCFVFFLVSQPLVYLVEIIAGKITFHMAFNYYRFWFILTLLCLPGGFIAFYAKKQNLLGSIVLGLGNTIQSAMGLVYIIEMSRDFPHHLLSILFCFASMAIMSICLQEKTKYRIVSGIAVPAVMMSFILIYLKISGLSII